jgi:putative ABC transport system permease protein
MVIAALFAGLALLLACVGLYGVVAYASAQRMPELAVRVAMGARRGDLVRLVVGHGAVLTFGGVTLGLLLAMGAARLLERFLFGVTPFDAATFVAASLVLAAAALVACYQPARRAAAVDPVTVLRSQ